MLQQKHDPGGLSEAKENLIPAETGGRWSDITMAGKIETRFLQRACAIG